MNNIHVFDVTALIALFRGYDPMIDLIDEADAGRIQLVWPACAIAEANTFIGADHNAWEGLLLGRVTVTELTAAGAINVGLIRADRLATGQVVHEARATLGLVVTLEPSRYRSWTVPLLVL